MVLQEVFKESAERVKKLPEATNDDKLELYALFKQSNIGDCNTSKFASPPPTPFSYFTRRLPNH